MRHTSKFMPMLLLLLLIANAPLTFAQEESEFNWAPGGNSLQWTDPTNWNAGDEDGPIPGGSEAVVNIGAGSPAYLNGGGGGGILTLNIGNSARLDIESGFLSFGPRTAARPFSMQNSGVLNVVGNTAEIRLRDQVANFSPAAINLDDGGKISIVDGDTTINTSNLDTGNGLITMGANTQIAGSGGAILTFEKQTIEGQGDIGTGSIGLRFDAETIVDANVNGGTLTVEAAAGPGAVNEGIMRATNGGTLDIRGPLTSIGALIEAQADSSVHLANGYDITGGTLRRTGTGTFSVSGSGRLADLTLDGTNLTVGNAANLGLAGTIHNQGDIAIGGSAHHTDLQIDEAVTLDGGGSVTLGHNSLSRITDDDATGGVLTNVDNTIQGRGNVGNGVVEIINQAGGTIDGNSSGGTLTLDPGAGATLTNRGLLTANSGGNLRFNAGDYDNTNGLIEIGDDSLMTLVSESKITGGTVRNTGTGTFVMSGTGTLEDLTIQGEMDVRNAHNLALVGTIENEGNIAIGGSANHTDLQIDEAVSLSGGGTVTLAHNSLSRITDDNGEGGVLTNVDNTIQGRGLVGNGLVQIINEADGTIDGNSSGGTLSVGAKSGVTSINRGLFAASDGGALSVVSGEFDNSAGRIESEDGSVVTIGGTARVVGGIYDANDNATIRFGDDSEVVDATLQGGATGQYSAIAGSAKLTDVLNQSSITIQNAGNLLLEGSLTNEGDLSIGGSAHSTDLQIDDAVTLDGGGTLTLTHGSLSRITDDDATGGVLTNVDNTIQGRGQVGDDLVQIINQVDGTIDGNSSGGTLRLNSASSMTNRGLLTANDGGNLSLESGDFDNVGGLVDVGDGSSITLTTGSKITGGVVRDNGTGAFVMSGTGTLEDLKIEGQMDVRNAHNLALIGAINNEGNIAIGGSAHSTDLQIDDAVSLSGGGTVTLAHNSLSRITDDDGGGVLTNVDNTIQGRGQVGDALVQVINQAGGKIDANSSGGSLTLNPGAAGVAMINRGLMTATSGGNLNFAAGDFDNAGSLIEIGDDSLITLNTGSKITGGTVRNTGTGTFVMSGTGTLEDLTIQGEMNVRNAHNLALIGAINNEGNIAIGGSAHSTDLQIDNAVSLFGGGTVMLAHNSLSRITDDDGGGVLTNVDNTIQGRGRVGDGLVSIENLVQGTILADQAGSSLILDSAAEVFNNYGMLSAINNSLLDVRGTTNNQGIVDARDGGRVEFETLVNALAGKLVGDGAIKVTSKIINNGKISPGNSPGTLTLDADLELGTSSRLEIELAGLDIFDELIINGDLELGGDLELVLLNGYRPDALDTFDVVMANTIAGAFSNVADGGRLLTSEGGSFQVNYGGGTVQLSGFSAVPEPAAATILMLAGVALLARRRRDCENR